MAATRRKRPEKPITHCLEVPQPRAELLVRGRLEVVNLRLPPKPELVGTRIAIFAGPVAPHDLWMLPELYGIEIQPDNWRLNGFRGGVIGSAVLRGWVRTDTRCKAVGQYRPGNKEPFKKLKAMLGPIGWVLRQPSQTNLPTRTGLRLIRAGYWDQPIVQRHLIWYADTYGENRLTESDRARLVQLRLKWKGRLEDGYNGGYAEAGERAGPPVGPTGPR